MAPGIEILPLLLCADGCLVLQAGAVLGRLARRLSASPPAAWPGRRAAYSPAERYLPCHRLSIGIPRA
jgi:hypothetical protein